MKQRGDMTEETDSLLRACWSLAEMLFSLRQNKRDGRNSDEELLGSAVQACWELCDIFREGWTAVRPDRNTPRPSQMNFAHQPETSGRESRQSNRSALSKRDSLKEPRGRKEPVAPVPETPVTEFEDTPISPDSETASVPNILVLGTVSEGSRGGRWSSNASNLSSYSHSSAKTSSTITTAPAENADVAKVKILVLKAAINVGYVPYANADGKGADGKRGGMASLQAFAKQLPPGSFGSLKAHTVLLERYKALVLDSSLPWTPALPPRSTRITATEVAAAVNAVTHLSQQKFSFLRDLFRFVFNFKIEEASSSLRKNNYIEL
jgi:hypothetical protein